MCRHQPLGNNSPPSLPPQVKGEYFVAFDSSFSIGLLDDNFHFRGAQNKLIGDQFRDKSKEESQFEGIAYVPENDTFLLLQEVQAGLRDTCWCS